MGKAMTKKQPAPRPRTKAPAKQPMRLHKWRDVEARLFTPEQIAASRARAAEAIEEMNLRAVRQLAGKTQKDIERATGIAQGDVSMLERGQDPRLSRLRAYVEALGGRLEVFAVFDDRQVRLQGV